jgi:hypothetical protein
MHKEDTRNKIKFVLHKKPLHFTLWLQMLLQTNAYNYGLLESGFMLCDTQVPTQQWYII